ncbi:MAG: hypothetical protein FD124_2331 [Alphaproteobacteria bacterium]|nr:MAG: hypothetical protein FD124_2331 [Alphaproteobacteria bacterium]
MAHTLNRRAVAGAGLFGLAACARIEPAHAAPADAIGVASAPNPHVFPLLLAIARDPQLPVRLIPIAESRNADALLQSGEAAAMLAMMTGAVPDLALHSLHFWRGFIQVAGESVRSFADLRGQRVIVSGPVGNGRGGGGDIIFQAAVRRAGLDPATDLSVEYMPVSEGGAQVAAGTAAAITIPSPGSTGLVARAEMARRPLMAAMARMRGVEVGPSVPLAAHIDMQRIFTGFDTFPDGQLPLGGFAVTQRAYANAEIRAKFERVVNAYKDAAALLMREPDAHADQVSSLFAHYYAALGAGGPPGMLLSRSIENGDLVYRGDIEVAAVRGDLGAWLAELNGQAPDHAFFAPG